MRRLRFGGHSSQNRSTLYPGCEADVAIFALDEGDFGFVDCGKTRLDARQRLRCHLTIRAGEIVYNPDGLGLPAWDQSRG